MKKVLTIVFSSSLLFSNFSVIAQNWVNGGNNLSAIGRLGTTSNQSLAFITSNTERARITSGGNFGIGTGSPITKLHVNGFGSFGNRVTTANATRAINLADDNAVLRVLRVDASNAPAVELISRTSADGANVAYWDFYAQPSDASFRIRDRKSGGSGLDRVTISGSDGSVGIGTTSPGAKLDVVGSTSSGNGINVSGYYNALSASSNYTYGNGVYGTTDQGYGIYGNSNYLGVYGYAGNGSYGTYGYSNYIGAYGGGTTYGTYGYSYSGTAGAYGYTYSGTAGVYGTGYNGEGVYGTSTNSYGGYFTSTNSYGIVASASSSAYYAGVFYGHVYSSDGFVTSDKNLKTNIHEFTDAMSIINKLKPQNYEFKKDAKYASLNLPKGSHYGLLAQDLEQVLPNLVSEAPHELKTVKSAPEAIKPTADGKPQQVPAAAKTTETTETIKIKAVNYVELIPIMVKAMQEQQATIEKQNSKIEALTQLVNQLSQNSHSEAAVKFSSLGLATPNPANNSTRISYSIPVNSINAVMIINNEAGQNVKQMQLDKSGLIDIDTSKLSSGTYFYTLLVNGTSIETKKMVVSR